MKKLDVIELQLKEVHAKVASIEDSVSTLDSKIHVLKTRASKLEKNVEELEEGFHIMKMMPVIFNVTTGNWSTRLLYDLKCTLPQNIFFRLNRSLHLFETQCAFLN